MSRKRHTPEATPDRRKLLAAEYGPPLGGSGPLRVALVYPHTYHVGMSSLGFQIALRLINDWPGGARAERFFTDTIAGGSIESGSPLADFDIIAFSATYEMDAPLVLDLIAAAGLPLEARHRGPDHPLVVMGGVLVSVNRLPLYPFFDLFAHGEAERLLHPLLELAGRPRPEALTALAETPGFEVTVGARAAAGLPIPDELDPLVDLLDRDLSGEPPPRPPAPPRAILETLLDTPLASAILTPNTEFADMGLIDLARGCPHHCTFCWIGHNAPAYRTRPMESIMEEIDRLARHTRKFGLVASAVGAHPDIDTICEHLMARNFKVSYSSLRVEEVTQTMLRALAMGGGKSVTIAPEAGAQRVRRLLGKRISDEQIFAVTEEIFGLGAENLKLYFIIGIPSETDDEALQIAAFTEKIRAIQLKWARPRGRMGHIGINLGVFVPKPNLPLAHIEPVDPAIVRRRLGKVVRALERIPNTRVAAASPELARAQAVLSMGGVEASHYVLAVRRLGMDWRAANRQWLRERGEDPLVRYDRSPRLRADALRTRTNP